MDQGTYNNVVRGNNPLSPVSSPSPSGTSYKTNVNRTKTRKWVEAKIQSYDGDDWGNEYDDIDDEPDEPPPPTRPTGLRQPGQSSQRPLPSTRTFSQPAATFESHMPGSSALRNPSGPPALHVQTQQSPPLVQSSMMPYERAPSMSPDLYAPGSGRLASHSPPVQIQSGGPSKQPEYYPVASPASQIGPASPSNTSATSSRFPPRKSSMSRQDIPDFSSDTGATRSGSRPASSSSNRGTIGTAAKPPTFVRPADIYRRVEEEREKERISMELVRPSMESVFGRNDHSSSPANAIRSPTEQRRRTSFESHDGSDAGRGMRTTLAPVAERKSEYGMDRFLDKSQGQSLPGEFSQLSSVEAQQAPSHEPAGDEAQVADVVKSRRLSTSPKLPDFARMSGFGDDFFSSTSRRDSQAAASLPPTQQTEKPAEKELGSSSLHSTEQPPPSMLEGPKLQANPDVIMPLPSEQTAIPQTVSSMPPDQPSAVRPRLPGTWVSETVSTASEQPTPMEKSEGSRALPPSSLQNIEVPPSGGETSEPADVQPTTKVKQLPGEDHVTHTTIETKEPVDSKRGTFTTPAGEHDDVVASKAIASGPGLHPAPPVLPPLKTENPLTHPGAPLANEIPTQQHSVDAPTAIWKDTPVLTSPTTQRNTATGKSEYSPTAPLNPHRSGLDQADAITPDTQERKSTLSSIATASPQKESDKLREEIIKSLSPSPLSTLDTSTTPAQPTGSPEPSQGTLTRESTYLSGVYDDYLSPVEEKSLRETSETPRQGHNMPSGYDTGGNSPPGESPMANVAPLNPRKSPEPGPSSRPRRFSWDQGPEQVTISPVDPKLESINFPEYSTSDATAGVTNDNRPSPSDGLKPEPEATGIISHRVSQVSSRAPDELAAGPLEPPSPVSFVAEVNSKSQPATINRDSYLSLAEEKESVLIPPTSRSTSPESQHPALSKAADPAMQTALAAEQTAPTLTTPQPKIMSFREILNIASTEQRIRKLEETRAQFAAMDSGLSNWLEQIRSEVEHADTAAAAAGGASPGPISPAQPSPSGVRPSTQQPYYQQYLNASASGSAGGQTGRTSSGNLQHMFSGQPGSGFGGSGNQVGAKSKELLHAAGAFGNKGMKSGMKLFNKGKSKLRGTGDKRDEMARPNAHNGSRVEGSREERAAIRNSSSSRSSSRSRSSSGGGEGRRRGRHSS
ncbi:hypothetical protein F4778DRAFT_243771 [Xylariomycetidae sp. FL2044]|nr:hypothetical protein F4778DRAFT_243771 [Xylariomycetidae sp. FL2044]